MILLMVACGGGSLEAVTYNIAGLPAGLSSSEPTRFIPQMAPFLNAYELVLVQEDFAYHDLLVDGMEHPYRSEPAEPVQQPVSDGLNRFGVHPMGPLERIRWADCNGILDQGSDCLSEKGFSVAVSELDRRASVTVVNLHADAGSSAGDVETRADNFAQLGARIASIEGPVIVAGDTNLEPLERDGDDLAFQQFLQEADVQDVCGYLACGDEHIDRFFFRSGDTDLVPTTWRVAPEFVDAGGEDLSDHPAIAVTFTW